MTKPVPEVKTAVTAIFNKIKAGDVSVDEARRLNEAIFNILKQAAQRAADKRAKR